MKLGLFGGTFDPPHIGHLVLASEAYDQLGLDRVLWILTHYPPHKIGQPIMPLAERLNMLQAAIDNDPAFELSRVDIDRPPPHFAVDTVRLIREQYPRDKLVYLMGGDSLMDLPEWHNPHEFILACDELGVMHRPDETVNMDALEARLPGLTTRVRFMQAPLLEISSSQIRQKITHKKPYRYFLPEAVFRLIRERYLYLRI